MDNVERTVVVAVPGGEAGAALSYAAADLDRRGGRARVAHVVPAPDFAGVPAPLVIDGETLQRVGTDVLDHAADELRRRHPDRTVLTDLVQGSTVSELVDAGRDADRIVLERRPRGWRRALTYSTSSGVAARAHSPVVVVPHGWTSDAERERTVVVAVDDAESAPLLLEAALDEAEARSGRVRLVHAWYFNGQYDDLVFAGRAAAAHEEELRADLERELQPVLKAHPDVPVDVVILHGYPSDLLVEQSESAGLLVLGRHRPAHRVGPHLGSVVRAVLRETACPVLVVDPSPRPA